MTINIKLIPLVAIFFLYKSHLTSAQCTTNDIEVKDTLVVAILDSSKQTMQVKARNIKEIKLLVYSKMGKKIFESSSSIITANATDFKVFDTGWDGTLEGEYLSEGMYVYVLEAQCIDRRIIQKSGNIVLTNRLVR